jgi:hypothetical protein
MKMLNFYKLFLVFLFIINLNNVSAQYGVVTGTMTDSDGEPLPGVNILIKGTQSGTITDLEGHYQLICNVGDVLLFSYVGYSTKELVVTSEMFDADAQKLVMNEPAFIHTVPVEKIENKAYSDYIKKLQQDTAKTKHTTNIGYKWYNSWRGRNYLNKGSYRNVNIRNNTIEFVNLKQAYQYEIELSSYVTLKRIFNPIALQSEYAQGRPTAGENAWFGPENNEIFAWGPQINNLSYDGIAYPFDNNGRLTPKSHMPGAKSYSPYKIFNTGIVLKNSIKIKGKRDDNRFNLSYTNRDEKGTLSPMRITSNNVVFNYLIKKDIHSIETDFNYYSEKDKYANINGLWAKTMQAILQTPPTFDNSQGYLVSGNLQRSSAPTHNNNPYFLLNQVEAGQDNNSFNAKIKYKIDFDHLNIALTPGLNKDIYTETYHTPVNTVGFTNGFTQSKKIDFTNYSLGLNANANGLNDFNLSTLAIMNFAKLNYQLLASDDADLAIKKSRNTLNWRQNAFYEKYLGHFEFKIDFKNNIYLADGKQKWFLPYIGASIDFAKLIYWKVFQTLKLKGNYNYAVSEFPLYLNDKSYSTLNHDFANFNNYTEHQNLFYNKNLKLEERESFYLGLLVSGDILGSGILWYSLEIDYHQNTSSNSIFPIYNGNDFELQNLAKIKTNSFDVQLDLFSRFNGSFKWEGKILFSKLTSKVIDLANGYIQVPIAGFQSVSKNLVKGQPAGVIIGSAYLRNKQGQLVIGNNGLPLVDDTPKIIGDPTPDFYLSFENEFKYKWFNLSILFDYQKGGDIWNGTKNTLSYLGLSQNTVQERLISNYIFDGVTEDGQINTTPVDFANPTNGLEENKWYNYGPGGVAEDAIEDGSWVRLKEISLSTSFRKSSNKFLKQSTFVIYVHNVWVSTNFSGASPLSWLNNYAQGQGLDYFNTHAVREFGFGIKLKI